MELGHTVRDRITGFIGIVTGIVTYISGCSQALVVPKVKADGTLAEGQWFDLQRLELQSKKQITLANDATPGPDAAPARRY